MPIKQLRSMFALRTVLASIMVTMPMLLEGCGSSTNAPLPETAPVPPPIAGKADVIISLDGAQHACVVALSSEAQGSTIPCTDVIPFLRDELRVPSGASYDLRTSPEVDETEMNKVRSALKDAGYRSIGGIPAQR